MESLHRLLARQISRHLDQQEADNEELSAFLRAISDAYHEADQDRNMLERSLELSSKELSQANSDLRAIFEAIPDLFFRTDYQGHILEYKSGSETGLKLSATKVLGKKLDNILPVELPEMLTTAIKRVRTSKSRISLEQSIKHETGRLHYEVRLLPLLEDQVLVIMRDITERKNVEEKIAQSKIRLEKQSRALSELATSNALHSGNIKEAFKKITEVAANTLDTSFASIWLYNKTHTAIHCLDHYDKAAGKHSEGLELKIEDFPFYFKSLAEDRAIAAHDARTDPRTTEFLDNYLIPNNITSMLDACFRVHGQYAGVICHEHTGSAREWTPDEQQFAASMADMIALIHETQERENAQRALLESEDRFRILAETTDSAIFAFRDKFVYVNPAMESITGYAYNELREMDLDKLFDAAFIQQIYSLRHEHTDSEKHIRQEAKILTQSGEIRWLFLAVGLVQFEGSLTCLANAFDITERKKIEEQLRFQAFHDELTGLANRALFIDRLGHRLVNTKRQNSYQCAVLFLDIDRFKVINDSLGHALGDELLIETGKRLKLVMRQIDTIARLGGDEFTVLLEDVTGLEEVLIVSERIQRWLKKPYLLRGHEVYSSVSIGIAIADASYQSPDQILRDADIAMYRAKAKGKACHEVFNPQMHAKAQKVLHLETNLRRALKNKEFQLYYQPIVSLKTGKTSSFEGLIRWVKPDGEIVSPYEFIPIAEETGMIIPIGKLVITEACEQLKKWRPGYPDDNISLTINLSSRQFEHDVLIEDIQESISSANIDPELLKLELTESIIMKNSNMMLDKLAELKALGLKLLIDDFGTGYSSLSYLHQFPIDALKIDRSFINNIGPNGENAEIVNAIISLAHNLGLKVIAEGVENTIHLQYLMEMKCDYAQGYYFARPVPAKEAEQFIPVTWSLEKTKSATSIIKFPS